VGGGKVRPVVSVSAVGGSLSMAEGGGGIVLLGNQSAISCTSSYGECWGICRKSRVIVESCVSSRQVWFGTKNQIQLMYQTLVQEQWNQGM
jgi:hypothetical protein